MHNVLKGHKERINLVFRGSWENIKTEMRKDTKSTESGLDHTLIFQVEGQNNESWAFFCFLGGMTKNIVCLW